MLSLPCNTTTFTGFHLELPKQTLVVLGLLVKFNYTRNKPKKQNKTKSITIKNENTAVYDKDKYKQLQVHTTKTLINI